MSTTTSLSVAAPPAAPSPPPSPPIPTLRASSSWSEGPTPSPTQLSPHIVASSPPSMRTTRPPSASSRRGTSSGLEQRHQRWFLHTDRIGLLHAQEARLLGSGPGEPVLPSSRG
ncbi:hypothetical protein AMTRI_Chr10g227570 [Amborella trichopoda]